MAYQGKKSSLFDLLEDLDYDECLAKAQAIAGVSGSRPSGKQQAFVFIKPHAVTETTKVLAKDHFKKNGILVYKEGTLTGPVIERDKVAHPCSSRVCARPWTWTCPHPLSIPTQPPRYAPSTPRAPCPSVQPH